MRDWIAHDYDGLDFDRLYYAVTHEVPEVLAVLQPYVEQQAQVQLTKRNPFDVPGSGGGSAYNTLALSRLFSSEANRKLPEDILRDMLRVEAWAYGLLTEGHTKR